MGNKAIVLFSDDLFHQPVQKMKCGYLVFCLTIQQVKGSIAVTLRILPSIINPYHLRHIAYMQQSLATTKYKS